MKSLIKRPVLLLVLTFIGASAFGYCDVALVTAAPNVEQAESSEPSTLESAYTSFVIGMDAYMGMSDMPGLRSYSDGMWAGLGTFYPSLTYLQWNSPGGQTARISMGMGDLYTDQETTLNQPVEAYIQAPVGGATLTMGKFWVPFAQEEWLYEAKPGVMAQWSGRRSSLAVAVNYSPDLKHTVTYARGSCTLAKDAEFGLSYALGEGFCSDSTHDRGYGLDATIGLAGFRLYGEYNRFDASTPGNAFKYVSGKLYYEKMGPVSPFVGVYSWDDDSGTFGDFRSTVYGLDYQVSDALAIQGAVSRTSDGSISWLQVHWNWEKSFLPRW